MTVRSPLVQITESAIDARDVERAVWSASDGAMVTFSGVVRDHDGGRDVLDIEYSAHPTARDVLERLAGEVATEHMSRTRATGEPLDPMRTVRLAAVHRVGVLPVGETAVVVVAVAPHRAEAFAACADFIDRIKQGVPIWKRQRFTDGVAEWVGVGDC